MRSSILVVALLVPISACSFDGTTKSNAGSSDGGDDGFDPDQDAAEPPSTDARPDCQSFASHIDTCSLVDNGGSIVLDLEGTYTYDTDMGVLEDPAGAPVEHVSDVFTAAEGDLRAILASQFQLGATSRLRATGSLPFAIASFGDIDVQGEIDVRSGGAGARADCGASTGSQGGDREGGAGGGGGGGFQGGGGAGGEGDSDGSGHGAPGPGGVAAAMPASPLGGCRGGDGGRGEDPGGAGGRGGGAVYLAASGQIDISGSISAGGQGGRGGVETGTGYADAGGGGGGSGGYILLEAQTVNLSGGTLAANGGGGGEGSGNSAGGNNGQPGLVSDVAAAGGSDGTPTGSDGGVGSAGTTLAGSSVNNSQAGGAGAGGGGAGFILVLPSQSLGGLTSPPAL